MQTHTTDRTFAPAESIALAPRAGPLAFFFGGVLIAAIMARTVTLAGREVVFGSRNVTFQNSDGNAQDPARHVRRLGLDEPSDRPATARDPRGLVRQGRRG